LSTTTSTYLSIQNNLARYQKMVANEPSVKTATDYYAANIGKVTSIKDLVSNYRLLSYALTAYGLGDQVNNKALITKVLQGGVNNADGTTNTKALANTLANANWAKFAAAFDFVGQGASSVTSSTAVATTEAAYSEQTLESQQGKQDVGVQLALYFQRVAPTIKSPYSVLGDKNLLEAFQTIFGITLNSNGNIDTNASIVDKMMPIKDLQDPTKLKQLTARFTAQYTLLYGPGGQNASTPLTANSGGTTTSTVNAATSIMSGIISGNSTYAGSSTAELFSSALLTSLQGLSLGG
jgi:hypothetical protein